MQTHTVDSTQTQTTLEVNESNEVSVNESTQKYSTYSKGYQALGRKYFPVLGQLDDLTTYRSLKADILESAQIAVLKYALRPDKLEKSGSLQLMQCFEILNKALRLDAGLSTENISTRTFGSLTIELPKDNCPTVGQMTDNEGK